MLDQLSPAAPARVRAVLLPAGQIKRVRFSSFVERLQPEHIVRLGDVSPDGRPHRNMFSPLAFQMGMIVYDLITFFPSDSHIILSPFEIYREPLVIIAIADGTELNNFSYNESNQRTSEGIEDLRVNNALRELEQDLKCLKDRYRKALVHKMILFDYLPSKLAANLSKDIVTVPPPEMCKRTTLKTIMCDISSRLLADMTVLAKSVQELKTLDSPSISQLSRGSSLASANFQGDEILRNSLEQRIPENRRNSLQTQTTDHSLDRMSLPATMSNMRASSIQFEPNQPIQGGSNSSSVTENRIPSSMGDSKSFQKASDHHVTGDRTREKNQDRNSIPGFGSGNLTERSRGRLKGRKCTVIGSLYMLAGRWSDALKELVEGASIAKSFLDHIWHAKALDNILVSMLMLAWCGLGFQIPQICYISAEQTPIPSAPLDEKDPALCRRTSLLNLTSLLPELIDRISTLYTRAANNTNDWLPQLPFSEFVIRFSKLLSAIHLNGGSINSDVLELAVLGTPSLANPNTAIPRLNIRPARSEILTVIIRAFPTASSDNLSTIDRTTILSGIASVLSSLGYRRKKALVIRELVSYLIHGLVQARIKGAAEIGVHPTTGLATLKPVNGKSTAANVLDLREGDVGFAVDELLNLLGQSYGVGTSSFDCSAIDDSDEAIVSRILRNASMRAFGDQKIKMDVLRSCINISEALPDHRGVLRFTAELLRIAGCGVAPGPRSNDASPSINHAEQVKLATNISRIAAKSLGDEGFEVEYWDEFLLRGIELEIPPARKLPIPHTRSELPGAITDKISTTINPFIYNPFLRTQHTVIDDPLLVAGEVISFKATLQNPFEFDLEIESMSLESTGVEFNSEVITATLGPYRTQIFSISGTPKESGQLRITGCFIKILGCRDRRFPIFKDPWSPQREFKIRTIGVADLFKPKVTCSVPTASNTPPNNTSTITPPNTDVLVLKVIRDQPTVIVKTTTLTQSTLMILEGEQKKFSITLQNTSLHTPVDLLLFSFKDSTQENIQAILNNRESDAAEIYECELMLAHQQTFKWRHKDGEMPFISPGGTATFDIEVLGKPGLTHAVVQIDYAYLGVPIADVGKTFYTRQINLPVTVIANPSVELSKINIVPLPDDTPRSLLANLNVSDEKQSCLKSDGSCLVLLDFRNAWSSNVIVSLDIASGGSIKEEIPSGHTSRIIVPIRRIFLEDAYAFIPSLNPSRQRQFVVSDGKITVGSERAKRKAFWYKEELLKVIQGTWSSKSISHREGKINLRSIKLDPTMIDAIQLDELDIHLSLDSQKNTVAELFIDTFAELKIRVINNTSDSIFAILRLQPMIFKQPHNPSLDISKQISVNGVLQQSLPMIPAKGHIEISLGIITLAQGKYEIDASVEETRIQPSEECANSTKDSGRPRANTLTMMNAIFRTRERRIWHSRNPLLIVARDIDMADDNE